MSETYSSGCTDCCEKCGAIKIPVGPKGDKGDPGDDGATGPQGPQGPQGQAGATGPQGPQGDAGPQGIQGDQGIQGPVGPQGPAGPQGPTGPQGDTGPQGIKGDKGDTGSQGPSGDIAFENAYTNFGFSVGVSLFLVDHPTPPVALTGTPTFTIVNDNSSYLKVGKTVFVNVDLKLNVVQPANPAQVTFRFDLVLGGAPDTANGKYVASLSAKDNTVAGRLELGRFYDFIEDQRLNVDGGNILMTILDGEDRIKTDYLDYQNFTTSDLFLRGQLIISVD